ncbi:MAG: hypothetical protein WBB22_15590 [Anaerolineae bacterium]
MDRLRGTGATNFATVWQAAALGSGTYLDRPVEAWYPGDEYVDWVVMSYFSSVQPIQDNLLDFARAHGKPVMIGGAPITQVYADGYAPDAASAIELARSLMR